MTLEEQSRLSYYRKISDISGHKNVELVQHVENGRIYVKKHRRSTTGMYTKYCGN